jgi:hypothetical protein
VFLRPLVFSAQFLPQRIASLLRGFLFACDTSGLAASVGLRLALSLQFRERPLAGYESLLCGSEEVEGRRHGLRLGAAIDFPPKAKRSSGSLSYLDSICPFISKRGFLATALRGGCGIGPRKNIVDLAVGIAVDDLGQDVGQVELRIDAAEFAGLDQRGDDRPISASPSPRSVTFSLVPPLPDRERAASYSNGLIGGSDTMPWREKPITKDANIRNCST